MTYIQFLWDVCRSFYFQSLYLAEDKGLEPLRRFRPITLAM
jgi:hypothetical protein